jgi:elongation factor G
VLLEPIDAVDVLTPDRYLGEVLGDLSARRSHILGSDVVPDGQGARVRALVPRAELHLYASDLSSITHGRGRFTRTPSGYEQVPGDAAKQVLAATTKGGVLEGAGA